VKPRTRPPRTPSKLPVSVHHQLNMYTIAAGAAGVGMLALAQPVEGKIVYTPAHQSVLFAGINLDLNHDGIADFRLCYSNNTYHCTGTGPSRPPGYFEALLARPINTLNGVVGKGKLAAAIVAGKSIGGKRAFPIGDSIMALCSDSGTSFCYGPWLNITNRYLGFKFVIKGKIHYGWARLNVNWKGPRAVDKATLTGYAYETIPNKAIIAGATKEADDENQPADVSFQTNTPEPATVGMLALGAPGLSIWRRKDELVGAPKGI
jgi:hypothetical protein